MFYVYVYYDPRPLKLNQPVYVGKGTGDRDISHWSRGSHNKLFQDFISHLKKRGLIASFQRMLETESEEDAFAKEIELIALYGRRNIKTGTLFNLTDGGEGASGMVKTAAQRAIDGKFTKEHWKKPEYRTKVVAAQTAAQNTPKALAIKSKNSTKLWQQQHEVMAAGIKAARSTEESKAKTSAQAKAQWADPEYAARQTANNQEIANRAEVKAAKAAAVKALWADPEWRAKMLEARIIKKSNKLLAPH